MHSWQILWHFLLHGHLNQAVYLHFVYFLTLAATSLNMLVSLRGAASLWIKYVSTKMKTYTINHWYAWCWSCERWELMKLSNSSFKHHRQNIVPPVLAASHRQTYGDNMSSSESSDVSLTIHRSKLPTGDHPRMAMWVWNCRFSTQINHQIYLTKIGFKPLDFGGAHLDSLLPTEIYKQSLVSDFSQLRETPNLRLLRPFIPLLLRGMVNMHGAKLVW